MPGASSVLPSALTTPAVTVQFNPYGFGLVYDVRIRKDLTIGAEDEARSQTTVKLWRGSIAVTSARSTIKIYTYYCRSYAFCRRGDRVRICVECQCILFK